MEMLPGGDGSKVLIMMDKVSDFVNKYLEERPQVLPCAKKFFTHVAGKYEIPGPAKGMILCLLNRLDSVQRDYEEAEYRSIELEEQLHKANEETNKLKKRHTTEINMMEPL